MTRNEGAEPRAKREHDQEVVREALAAGRNYAEAGSLAGVSERTVRRWMSDSAFATQVSVRRGERVGAITGQLVGAGEQAVAVLRECLQEENAAIRIRAAQALLTLGTQLRHAHELEERLTALEASSPGRSS